MLLTRLLCLLTLQPITGMRLAGSIRLQTNVHVDTGRSSWLVPIGRRLLPDSISLDLIRRTFKV